MECRVYEVYAFCHDGQGGNGAGVVMDEYPFTHDQKLSVAAEMGFSETVFISSSSIADYRLEYFTPLSEVDLCGHATIATFVLLISKGLPAKTYTIETRSGVLTVKLDADGSVLMQQCCPTFFEQYPPEVFSSCLPIDCFRTDLPIQAVSTGLKDILVPIDSVERLLSIKPDFESMAALNKSQGVVGIHAFALTSSNTAECRNFAPLYDIDEESATGTSNCALACYLHRYHAQHAIYRFLQGRSMSCPSDIEVHVESAGARISNVMVGGKGRVHGSRLLNV